MAIRQVAQSEIETCIAMPRWFNQLRGSGPLIAIQDARLQRKVRWCRRAISRARVGSRCACRVAPPRVAGSAETVYFGVSVGVTQQVLARAKVVGELCWRP